MSENFIVTVDCGIATLQINRAERMNALSQNLLNELREFCREVDADDAVSVVVICGNDKYFSAGADLYEIAELRSSDDGFRFTRVFAEAFRALEELSIPVIAALQGYVLGGGFELALSCDLRYAAESAVFGLPEVDLGVFPAAMGTQTLPRLIGPGNAKELLLIGRKIDAVEAFRMGIVNGVFPTESFMEEVLKVARILASKPRAALTANKRLATVGMEMPLYEASQYQSTYFAAMSGSEEFRARVQAFVRR